MARAQRSAGPRVRGRGGIVPVRDGVWRVDVEIAGHPETGRRRRLSRVFYGSRQDAERALAELAATAAAEVQKTMILLGARFPADQVEELRRRASVGGRSVADELRLAVGAWLAAAVCGKELSVSRGRREEVGE